MTGEAAFASQSLSRTGSEEFSTGLVTIEKTQGPSVGPMTKLDSDRLMQLGSMGDIYKLASVDFSAAAFNGSRASFTQWHSQGNLLMEMKRADRRMRHESNALFDGNSSDSGAESEFGVMRIVANPDQESENANRDMHDVFFTKDSKLHPVNNDVVRFLLKTFRNMDEAKLISAPFELKSQIEEFRSRIFDTINKEFHSLTLCEALLTVAFNHYAGHTRPGFMTIDEYTAMMKVYHGVFSNDGMTRFVFDSMDRKRKGVIALNDFIAGMLSCSPRALHKVNSPSGRLRLQHIFRAYDVKRKGYLNVADVRSMLEHIHNNSQRAAAVKDDAISPKASPYRQVIPTSNTSEDSGRQIDETMDAIMSGYENGFGYDAFYTCVNNGTIRDTHLLLRSEVDFSEMIGKHLIHALSHIVVTSDVAMPKETIPADVMNNRMMTQPLKPQLPLEPVQPKPADRVNRPSLWSTVNSPRNSERTVQSPPMQPVTFPRDDGQRLVQSARGKTVAPEPSITASARDRFTMAVSNMERKPLFHQAGHKSNPVDAHNFLSAADNLFKKNKPFSTASDYTSKSTESIAGSSTFTRVSSVTTQGSTIASSGIHTDTTHHGGDVLGGEPQPPKPVHSLTNIKAPVTQISPGYSAAFTYRNSIEEDGDGGLQKKHLLNKAPEKLTQQEMPKPAEPAEDKTDAVPTAEIECEPAKDESIPEVPPEVPQQKEVAEDVVEEPTEVVVEKVIEETATELPQQEQEEEDAFLPQGNDIIRKDSDSTSAEDDVPQKHTKDIGSIYLNRDIELDTLLTRRITDLVRRYRARFVGFNSAMLSDYEVALKFFGKVYARTFKVDDYNAAFETFPWCSYSEMVELFDVAAGLVKKEPALHTIQGSVQIHGPLNGNVFTLIESFNTLGWPVHGPTVGEKDGHAGQYAKGEATKLLFLGNLVGDVQGYSLETLMVLLALKILFPYHIYLLRGSRESRKRDYKSTLFREIHSKLERNAQLVKLATDEALILQSAHELYHRVHDIFDVMSVAACIEDTILCVHGALPKTFRSLEPLRQMRKPIKLEKCNTKTEANSHVRHAIFGTFSQIDGSQREDVIAPCFNHDEFKYSLKRAGMSMLITAGSVDDRGYNYMYGERLLQMGSCTPGATYSVAHLRQHRRKHFFLTHRSIEAP
ncbi:serine/threonine phosphatase domain containing protein [Babesia gibsoni]|uniref:Serine/threonine phosphatase domain containing protein n=1 Tax=Babesia gibsoni TaxID=33632 RepID=A0AAD8PG04_BABGI|nr:serine/threonine phosphatase domain containing protein [Babesia gibsoni]